MHLVIQVQIFVSCRLFFSFGKVKVYILNKNKKTLPYLQGIFHLVRGGNGGYFSARVRQMFCHWWCLGDLCGDCVWMNLMHVLTCSTYVEQFVCYNCTKLCHSICYHMHLFIFPQSVSVFIVFFFFFLQSVYSVPLMKKYYIGLCLWFV